MLEDQDQDQDELKWFDAGAILPEPGQLVLVQTERRAHGLAYLGEYQGGKSVIQSLVGEKCWVLALTNRVFSFVNVDDTWFEKVVAWAAIPAPRHVPKTEPEGEPVFRKYDRVRTHDGQIVTIKEAGPGGASWITDEYSGPRTGPLANWSGTASNNQLTLVQRPDALVVGDRVRVDKRLDLPDAGAPPRFGETAIIMSVHDEADYQSVSVQFSGGEARQYGSLVLRKLEPAAKLGVRGSERIVRLEAENKRLREEVKQTRQNWRKISEQQGRVIENLKSIKGYDDKTAERHIKHLEQTVAQLLARMSGQREELRRQQRERSHSEVTVKAILDAARRYHRSAGRGLGMPSYEGGFAHGVKCLLTTIENVAQQKHIEYREKLNAAEEEQARSHSKASAQEAE